MSARFEALALPDVRRATIASALNDAGVELEGASHVTATGSLAKPFWDEQLPAVTIAHLIDLIVWSGLEPALAAPVTDFPAADVLVSAGADEYQDQLSRWRNRMTGRRMGLSMSADVALRRYLRTGASDRRAAEVLLRAQRDFRKSVQSLIAADIRPSDFSGADGVTRVAREAWEALEDRVPAITAVRADLWIDPDDRAPSNAARVGEVLSRISAVLDHVFGVSTEGRTIVHHGFYFYTPPQWALFQLLRHVPGVDQIFIVHDDGANPVFETWRRFFVERWRMPSPRSVVIPSTPTAAAEALRGALEGRSIDSTAVGASVEIVEHKTSAEFVRDLAARRGRASQADEDLSIFAADASSVDRLVDRLGPGRADGTVDLAHLPVGQFLLSVHDAIRPDAGRVEFELRQEQVVDIAASGYVDGDDPDTDPSRNVGALRRAMPFFRGCVSLQDWTDRVRALELLVRDEVEALGGKRADHTDVDRMRIASTNPLRTVPWADLTVDEAVSISVTIDRITKLIGEIAEYESRSISDYLEFVRTQLQRGMARLDERTRSEIDDKLRGFVTGAEAEMDVEGLVEAVRLLLGREADFDHTGEPTEERGQVRELRGLDALGRSRSQRDLYLANLADGVFPTRLPLVGWPFRAADLLDDDDSDLPAVSVEIMRTRSETAAISDLYLFWLALDGLGQGRKVTLSWVERSGTERRNPSPIVSLVSVPDHGSESVCARAGGIPRGASLGGAHEDTPRSHPTFWSSSPPVPAVIDEIPPVALGAAAVCPRRFALQWAVGPTVSFGSEHNQVMLYGNVLGVLERLSGMPPGWARRLCKDLWRHLSRGERASSYYKRVVQEQSGPRNEWVRFLEGSQYDNRYQSRGYQVSVGARNVPSLDETVGDSPRALPGRPTTSTDICLNCPVQSRCLEVTHPDRR